MTACGESAETPVATDPKPDTTVVVIDTAPEPVVEEPNIVVNTALESGKVGDFEAGKSLKVMPVGFERSFALEERSEEGETWNIVVATITMDGEEYLKAETDCENLEEAEDCPISQMYVTADLFRTSKGMGVGTTIEEFIATHQDHTLWYTYVSEMWVIDTESMPGVQFLLDPEDYTKELQIDSDMMMLDPADFKEGAAVKRIRVY